MSWIRDDDILRFLSFIPRWRRVRTYYRIFLNDQPFNIQDRALALRVEREERALRAEEAGLELLHRASGSGVRRSAVELRRAHHWQLQINERRKLSVKTASALIGVQHVLPGGERPGSCAACPACPRRVSSAASSAGNFYGGAYVYYDLERQFCCEF
jgi:hypothetical protein